MAKKYTTEKWQLIDKQIKSAETITECLFNRAGEIPYFDMCNQLKTLKNWLTMVKENYENYAKDEK